MASFVKVWTTLCNKPEFLSLSHSHRGIYLQMLLWCKNRDDSGIISAGNWSQFGGLIACDQRTLRKALVKLQSVCLLTWEERETGAIVVEIPKYRYWQDLDAKDAAKKYRSILQSDCKITHSEENRIEENRIEEKYARTNGNRSPHARFCLWIDSDTGRDYQAEARSLYPHISVSHEVEKAKVWIRDNPKRGNKKNWRSFMTRWFSRAEESISRKTGQAAAIDTETFVKEHEEWEKQEEKRKQEWEKYLDEKQRQN